MIHRDIKSANIMVTPEGQAKIMDFGLAKLQGRSDLTRSGTTLGTVPYMSPEQARGERVDHRTDLWSLGVVLYQMLSGDLPFGGDTDLSVIHSIVHEEPKPLKATEPPVPEELKRVVARALTKHLEARYGSAEEMLEDLRAYQANLRLAEAGMVRVAGAQTAAGRVDDFFIDAHEVTNRQYKAFVDSDGYRKKEFWTQRFASEGKELTWQDALERFVDQTGRPGPATWQAGDCLEGQSDYPASGISWCEAAAYARFAGKTLPTKEHWGLARGEATALIMWPQLGGDALFAPFSNFFRGRGPMAVGSLPGITPYGAFDMAGIVREWCWNETPKGRLIRGGAWDDNTYMFGVLSQAPPMDRSPRNGFRCARYPDPENVPPPAFDVMAFNPPRDYSNFPSTRERSSAGTIASQSFSAVARVLGSTRNCSLRRSRTSEGASTISTRARTSTARDSPSTE